MFIECAKRLDDLPLSKEWLTPVGRGSGIELAVEQLRGTFEREPSMIKRAALRDAIWGLYAYTYRPKQAVWARFVPVVQNLMAVGHVGSTVVVNREKAPGLTPQQERDAAALYEAVWSRLINYEHYSGMTIEEVIASPGLVPSDNLGLEMIAWSAIAFRRTTLPSSFDDYPEPDQLIKPGWYTEPCFAKMERYWDGSDWTSSCRSPQGRRYRMVNHPI